MFDAVIRRLPDPPPGLRRRAILTISNPDYNAGTYVQAKMLRRVGCATPLDVWHWRDAPPAPFLRGLPGVNLRHLDELPGVTPATRFDEVRSLLFLHCGLAECLWLGADVYPVAPVDAIWPDLVAGAVWWREVPLGDKFLPGNYGLPEHTRTSTFQIQGDTILLDLANPAVYRAVGLTHWFTRFPERFDRGGESHGDQTQYRAAWAVLGLPQFAYTTDRVDWQSFPLVYLHQNRDGKTPLFVHRVGSKWPLPGRRRFNGDPVFHATMPMESAAWGFYREALAAVERINV